MARRLVYQPSLDGLRAGAVLVVMFYHADVGPFHGGFLGVDIFFVLSGYLITSLLLTEYGHWRAIDLRAFWLQRARRLFPALFLMLFVVMVVGARLVEPERLGSLRADALSTLFYVANWRLVASGQSYFDQFLAPSPLVHTWSLAIEEQFYLIFPLLLLLVLRLGRGRRRPLLIAFSALALASATWMAWRFTPGVDPSAVYYSTFTRGQDLFVGATLAGLVFGKDLGGRSRHAFGWAGTELLGWCAAVALVVACLIASESDARLFRGGFLIVSVAVALVLRAVIIPGSRLGSVLSWEPARRIGLVSYGLYLWHWPIFIALSPARTGLGSFALAGLRFTLTGAVAYVSYRFLELPIRQGRLRAHLNARWVPAGALASGVVLVATILLSTSAAVGMPGVSAGPGALSTELKPPEAGQISVLVAGDSTARDLAWNVPPDLTPGLAVSSSTLTGCGIAVQAIVLGDQVTPEQKQCRGWDREWSRATSTLQPDIAVLAVGTWEVFDHFVDGKILRVDTPEYRTYLTSVYQRAVQSLGANGRPVVVLDVPCFQRIPWSPTGVDVSSFQNDPRRAQFVNGVLDDLARVDATQVTVIHQSSVLCSKGVPANLGDGTPLRPDGVHVSAAGGAYLWHWLEPQLRDLVAARHRNDKVVLAVGDSVVDSLAQAYRSPLSPGLRVIFDARASCGIEPSGTVVQGRLDPTPAECAPWQAEWRTQLARLRPAVLAAFFSIHEARDLAVPGGSLEPGSNSYRAHMNDFLDSLNALAASNGSRLVLVNDPCHAIADFGVGPDPALSNSPQRQAALNSVLTGYAVSHPQVRVVDFAAHMCSGASGSVEGIRRLRPDGLHFNTSGAVETWPWLAGQLLAASQSVEGP